LKQGTDSRCVNAFQGEIHGALDTSRTEFSG